MRRNVAEPAGLQLGDAGWRRRLDDEEQDGGHFMCYRRRSLRRSRFTCCSGAAASKSQYYALVHHPAQLGAYSLGVPPPLRLSISLTHRYQ